MRRSMTGYGRGSLETDQGRFVLEIISVNRKGLDIHLHLPQGLLFMDPVMRKWVTQIAERGHITARVSFEPKYHRSLQIHLQQEKDKWEEISQQLHYPLEQITLPFLLSQISPHQSLSLDEAVIEQNLETVWKIASKAWMTMREEEGSHLQQDLETKIGLIQQAITLIEQELPAVVEMNRMKIVAYLEVLSIEADQDVIAKEAIHQAAASDIEEEMIRMKSHTQQFLSYLHCSTLSVGKTLDFLAQEMNREISTLLVKSGSASIANMGIEVKSGVEKIREQVQNIE
ncbi:MAG: DUF1732 domain-containing protein [Candidatus Rhabdochlamydia sp.]